MIAKWQPDLFRVGGTSFKSPHQYEEQVSDLIPADQFPALLPRTRPSTSDPTRSPASLLGAAPTCGEVHGSDTSHTSLRG